ncbi:hypothetical protein ACMX2H_17525 [Arthrobacter sulfonylureivorans]|uniref:hypothetical protein n=1 Tax=Arthrobacter sulfonylureivorans TaxID=2486855 RepID=UPI0039E6FA96
MTSESAWGVTVEGVLGLVPQAAVFEDDSLPEKKDPVYGGTTSRRITKSQVQQWITDVAAAVDLRLRRRSELPEELQGKLDAFAATVVRTGAGAYLSDAAFPAKSSVNDTGSYGSVLWTRYQAELTAAETALAEWLAPGGGAAAGKPVGTFPPSAFRDDVRW